jgi:hypothetical protein
MQLCFLTTSWTVCALVQTVRQEEVNVAIPRRSSFGSTMDGVHMPEDEELPVVVHDPKGIHPTVGASSPQPVSKQPVSIIS